MAARRIFHRGEPIVRGTVLIAAACVAAACTGTASTASGAAGQVTSQPTGTATVGATSGRGAPTDWTQFDENAARTGIAGDTPRAGRLKVAWTTHLDGAVYGQPLVIGERVIVATENDT